MRREIPISATNKYDAASAISRTEIGRGFSLATHRKRRQRIVRAMDNYWVPWGKYALVRFRYPYLEVDIDDMRPENRLSEIFGRGGALQLHVASTKFPRPYLVGSQSIIILSEMGNVILNLKKKRTAWANTDTRLAPAGILRTDR